MDNAYTKVDTIDVPEGMAIIFTQEMLDHLGAVVGDTLVVEETTKGLELKKESRKSQG